jgi:hypothetical protein
MANTTAHATVVGETPAGDGRYRLTLNNHAALFTWGVVNEKVKSQRGLPKQLRSETCAALRAAERTLREAYGTRTTTTTTAYLCGDQLAALQARLTEHLAWFEMFPRHETNSTPHLREVLATVNEMIGAS